MEINEKKLRVDYLIAHKNNLWAGMVILTGGLAGILLTINYSGFAISLHAMVKTVLFFLGFFLLSLMVIGVINIREEVDSIIKNKGG